MSDETAETADLSSWTKEQHLLAVDARGYVWRCYEGMWSMAPVNSDNSIIPRPVTFYAVIPDGDFALDCRRDHHGYCQEHGYEPPCPVEFTKRYLDGTQGGVTPTSGDEWSMTADEAQRLLAVVDEHARKTASAEGDPGHARLLWGVRVAYVAPIYGQSLPDFLRRVARERLQRPRPRGRLGRHARRGLHH